MKSNILSEALTNRINETSLQKILEAMVSEIRQMKIENGDEKKIISMLMTYRSAWNSYLNTLKGRRSDQGTKNEVNKSRESKKKRR